MYSNEIDSKFNQIYKDGIHKNLHKNTLNRSASTRNKKLNVSKRSGLVSYTELKASKETKIASGDKGRPNSISNINKIEDSLPKRKIIGEPQKIPILSKRRTLIDINKNDPGIQEREDQDSNNKRDKSESTQSFPTFYPLLLKTTTTLKDKAGRIKMRHLTEDMQEEITNSANKQTSETLENYILERKTLEKNNGSSDKNILSKIKSTASNRQSLITIFPKLIAKPELVKFPFYPESVEQIQSICETSIPVSTYPISKRISIPMKSNVIIEKFVTRRAAPNSFSEQNFEFNSKQSLPKRLISSILHISQDKSYAQSPGTLSNILSFIIKERSSFQKKHSTCVSLKNITRTDSHIPSHFKNVDETIESLTDLKNSFDVSNKFGSKQDLQFKYLNGHNYKTDSPCDKGNIKMKVESTNDKVYNTNINNVETQLAISMPDSKLPEYQTEGSQGPYYKFLHGVSTFLFSHVGILLLLFFYTIVGALIFQAIEGPLESENVNEVIHFRELTALDLAIQIKVTGIDYMDLEYTIERTLKKFQDKLIGFVERGFDGQEDKNMKKWSFAGALLYCVTVITTIGYGNIAPISNWGRILTILYALIGIPLLVLFLSNFGALLAVTFKWLCKKISEKFRGPQLRTRLSSYNSEGVEGEIKGNGSNIEINLEKVSKDLETRINDAMHNPNEIKNFDNTKIIASVINNDDLSSDKQSIKKFSKLSSIKSNNNEVIENKLDTPTNVTITEISPADSSKDFQVPVWACLSLMFGYLLLGSLSFSVWEGWDVITSFYFCFITLSTIGFGDIVPGAELFSASAIEKFVFVTIYIIFGMALMSMCFNLMQQTIVKTLKIWGNRIGLL
ncbi:unnamed protein product [Gordionus sp. m RMFG-2023]|uniref:uncharacterized protein LOC135928742 n=1 Tax=Gordionus sp. m RMFG-2023 TaxID=3053472 RepID=UPI0030E2E131